MNANGSRFRFLNFLLLGILLLGAHAVAEVSLQVPKKTPAGGPFEVTWTDKALKGRIDVVKEDGSKMEKAASYSYTNPKLKVTLSAPTAPGRYGVIFREQGKEPAGLVTFEATPVTATITGPDKASIGETIVVKFTGPAYAKDLIVFGDAEGQRLKGAGSYAYVGNAKGDEVKLRAPMEPGPYTILYTMTDVTLASQPIQIGGTTASLKAADSVQAGGVLEVFWEGPDNSGDFITLHDAEGKRHSGHAYTGNSEGNVVGLAMPEALGKYVVVYVTGGKILARRPVEVTAVSATLEARDEVTAGTDFEITWTGPGNRQDLIIMGTPGEANLKAAYRYLDPSENVTIMGAPLGPADYELRYVTGKGAVLATRPIKVIPVPAKPGSLIVYPNLEAGIGMNSAIEVILDASGSMLQKQDGKRRIEIARETLISLIKETIPSGTPFALRVFGHKEANSCRTDLEVPLAPLDPESLTPIIEKINAINLAKTPIAASLNAVASDLKTVSGERIVILLTDGEETCDGDPALAIRSLRAQGTAIRVNIVGYAIDDENLKQTFESWAALGGGRYLNAPSAEELRKAMRQALAIPYKVYAGDDLVASGVSGGERHELPAGDYTIKFNHGGEAKSKPVTINASKPTELHIP